MKNVVCVVGNLPQIASNATVRIIQLELNSCEVEKNPTNKLERVMRCSAFGVNPPLNHNGIKWHSVKVILCLWPSSNSFMTWYWDTTWWLGTPVLD